MAELIAVLSGKGGTGKTSVCAGLATALARDGLRVLCIDCDIGLQNLDIALGISELGALCVRPEVFTDRIEEIVRSEQTVFCGCRVL